jgi:hypothetical protein
MSKSIITNKLKTIEARSIVDSISNSDNSYYMFLGKNLPWTGDVPDAIDNLENLEEIYRNIFYIKKITPDHVSLGAKRYDWISGVIYDFWDSADVNIHTKKYYVITTDFNVYLCISNNDGSQSTVMPTGRTTGVITTGDGYRWLYLYTISTQTASDLLSITHIPVKTLITDDGSDQWHVQRAAIAGGIMNVIISNIGDSYYSFVNTIASATSNTAVLNGTYVIANDVIKDYDVYITSGLGVGQYRRISAWDLNNKRITITDDWTTIPDSTSHFNISPAINVDGDGSDFKAYSVVSSGNISNVVITNYGTHYNRISLNVVKPTNWTGTAAVLRGIISPSLGHGADAVNELSTDGAIIDCVFMTDEGNTLSTNTQYRISGLLYNPLLANGSIANANYYRLTTDLSLANTSGSFILNEKITGMSSNASAYIVDNYGIMSVIYVNGTFSNGEGIRGITSNATANISAITNPLITHNSGNILYYKNRNTIYRSDDQLDDCKLVITF